MRIKKIKDLNFYEILNLDEDATSKDIEKAYHLGKATYSRDSLAHYSLLSDRERWYILRRIEEAYQNLNDPDKRKVYNLKMRLKNPEKESRTKYRKSTQKLEIEYAEEKKNLWQKIKFFLFSLKKK
jgi:DnaJ-class molecular chaperone